MQKCLEDDVKIVFFPRNRSTSQQSIPSDHLARTSLSVLEIIKSESLAFWSDDQWKTPLRLSLLR